MGHVTDRLYNYMYLNQLPNLAKLFTYNQILSTLALVLYAEACYKFNFRITATHQYRSGGDRLATI